MYNTVSNMRVTEVVSYCWRCGAQLRTRELRNSDNTVPNEHNRYCPQCGHTEQTTMTVSNNVPVSGGHREPPPNRHERRKLAAMEKKLHAREAKKRRKKR